KDIIDSGTKLMVIGSALAFKFNKFGGSEYVRNKIRELFDKPTIYTIRRRKTGFFGSKSNDNLVKPEDLILPMSTRKQVNELMFLINRRYEMSKTSKRKLPLPHVLLYGPPGTGKTTIAQMIADNTIGDDGQPMKLISLMASDFMQIKAEGDRLAVLKKMFTEAIQMRNTIIFLDEIDALLKQRGGPNESSNRACVDMLLFYTVKLSADYMVIGGTNHLKDMDEAALSRFRRKIGIPLPSLRNRKLILELYVRDKLISKSYTSQLDIAAIAGIMVGASGRDLESFVTRLRDRIDFENGNTATPALAEVILSEMGYLEGKASDVETFDVEDDFIQK
ncbi:MAG: ATP-binding protein, partial [bacterium]